MHNAFFLPTDAVRLLSFRVVFILLIKTLSKNVHSLTYNETTITATKRQIIKNNKKYIINASWLFFSS